MSDPRSFRHLLAPGRIGTLQLRNRIVMSPMGSNLAEKDGHLGERIKRYYEERARGGAGLIIPTSSPPSSLLRPTGARTRTAARFGIADACSWK